METKLPKPGTLSVGIYPASDAFRAIDEHVAVLDYGGGVIATTGSSWTGSVDETENNKRIAQLLAAAPELLKAAEAAMQCIEDFLEIYKFGGSMIVLDAAVKSLRNDALPLVNASIASATGVSDEN